MGISQVTLGKQMVDGRPFMEFVRSGPGPSLAIEGARYLALWQSHMAAVAARRDDPDVIATSAMSIGEWLDKNRFVRVKRFMLRAITTMGYGFLDEVTALQAMRWCTPALIASGMFSQLKMPVEGWQTFWERLALELDVHVGEPVEGVERDSGGVTLTTRTGVYRFGQVLITVPLDEAARFMALTERERFVRDSILWGGYTTTLCSVDKWFRDYDTESYTAALAAGAQAGRMLGVRRILNAGDREDAHHLYIAGQYSGANPDSVLAEKLAQDVNALGAKFESVVAQRTWKYFPRYRSEAIRAGLLREMASVQGEARTWYSGATFSHEAVSNIVAFNHGLVRRIAPALAA